MCLRGVGFARSFEFSFSLGSQWRDGGTLRLIYDNGSGAASPAAEDNFFFSPTRCERKLWPGGKENRDSGTTEGWVYISDRERDGDRERKDAGKKLL